MPRIQNWIDERGSKSHEKKHSRIRGEYGEVLYYALRPEMMIGRMLVTTMSMIFFAILFIVTVTFAVFLGLSLRQLAHPGNPPIHRTAFFICLISAMLTCCITLLTLIFRRAKTYFDLFFNVKHLESYFESLPTEVRRF